MTREKLEQLSEEELETLYQQKKTEYNQKIAKNRRVRGILSRKVDEKQERVQTLKNQISALLDANPQLKLKFNSLSGAIKQDFDDTDYNPEELTQLIQEKQKILSQLQSKKLQIEKSIPELSNHIEQQKLVEDHYQKEITQLISQTETISDSESSEMLELDQLSQEIKSAQAELEALISEIEELHKGVHQQG